MRKLTQEDLVRLLDKRIFHLISETADAEGMECYVVGGYVRDLFLERPSQDIDVVTVGSGIRLARALANRLGTGAHLMIPANRRWRTGHWKTTRTAATSPSMPWPYV